jgi:hypothetical protein
MCFVLVYFLIWIGFSLFLYSPAPVWGLVCIPVGLPYC